MNKITNENEYIRSTFIIKKDSLEKIKNYAYWERSSLKNLFNSIIENFIRQNISKNPEKFKDAEDKDKKLDI